MDTNQLQRVPVCNALPVLKGELQYALQIYAAGTVAVEVLQCLGLKENLMLPCRGCHVIPCYTDGYMHGCLIVFNHGE